MASPEDPGYGDGTTTADPNPSPAPSAPADPWAGKPDSYGTVRGYYQQYLGRDAESPDAVANWLNGSQGRLDLVQSGIQNSDEAKAYAARQAGGSSSGGGGAPTGGSAAFDPGGWVNSQLSAAQSTDDPNYWLSHINGDPNVQNAATRDSALAYWAGRIAQGDGALAVRNGSVPKFQDGGNGGYSGPSISGTGPAPGQGSGTNFADPAYQALNALAQARIASLQQPQSFPQLDTLMQQLQAQQAVNKQRAAALAGQWGQRVTELQQPLLTTPQVVQQRALAENNLLDSRDAALANAKASQSARGFAPTSGIAGDQARQINENASNQQAQIEARLQQANIGTDEARRNEATQLQGLITQALNGGDATSLQQQAQAADLENQLYQTDQQRQTQQLAAAQIPVDLTNTGFNNASSAISNPNSALAALMPLISASLGQQSTQFGQANSQASGLSQIISQLLGAFT